MESDEVALVSLKQRVVERLPHGLKTMAVDSVWSMGFELTLLLSITTSFILLGRELGTEGYGEYVGLFAITTPLSTVGSASMLAAMQYMFAEEKPVERVMSIFLTLTLAGGAIAAVVAVLLAEATLSTLSFVAIVAMSISEVIVFPMGRVVGAGVRALHGVPASVRVELAFIVARFALLLSVFAITDLTILKVAVGWLFTNLAVLSWLLLRVLPKDHVHPRLVRVHPRDLRVTGALGAPIFISDFQTNGDKVVLGAAGYKSELGLYGAAFRVVQMGMMPLRAMDIAVFHRFLQSDSSAFGQHTRRARNYSYASILVILPIAAGLWLFAPQLELVLGEEFAGSVEMMRWLVLWLPIRAISGAPMNGLLGLGRLGLRLVVLIAGAATAVTIYVLVIPGVGWEGAVLGTIVGELALVIGGWIALVWAQRQHDDRVRADATGAPNGDQPRGVTTKARA